MRPDITPHPNPPPQGGRGSDDIASTLSHIDESGRAHMVDVSAKAETMREATARGRISMAPATLALIEEGGIPKGDVFSVAQIAGIMAAKQIGSLIPMCHHLPVTGVDVRFG